MINERSLKLTCIICPRGCEIKVTVRGGEIIRIEGYGCPRGKDYAEKEIREPVRTLMSVVRCIGGDLPVVSVKTDKAVPKEKLLEISKALAIIQVEAPIRIGDILVKNVLGLDANIVATRPCAKKT